MDLRKELGRPARRLRVKTCLGKDRLQFKFRNVGKKGMLVGKQFAFAEVGTAQDPLAELEDWAAQEKPGGRRAVYLVTETVAHCSRATFSLPPSSTRTRGLLVDKNLHRF